MTASIQHVKRTIGNNLKKIRQRLGLSHIDLADASGIAKGSIIKIEKGEKGYTIDSLLILINTVGFTLAEICSEKTIIPEYALLKVKISQYYARQGQKPPAELFRKQEKRVKNIVVSQLLPSKFLNKSRHLNEILEYCKSEFGVNLKSASLSNTLKRLAKQGVLEIIIVQPNAFKYRKAKSPVKSN